MARFMRKENKEWLKTHATYKNEGEIRWRCNLTTTPIMIEETSRSHWVGDDLGPCAGSGEVMTVLEAYCPSCTNVPKVRYGSPIQQSELLEV